MHNMYRYLTTSLPRVPLVSLQGYLTSKKVAMTISLSLWSGNSRGAAFSSSSLGEGRSTGWSNPSS